MRAYASAFAGECLSVHTAQQVYEFLPPAARLTLSVTWPFYLVLPRYENEDVTHRTFSDGATAECAMYLAAKVGKCVACVLLAGFTRERVMRAFFAKHTIDDYVYANCVFIAQMNANLREFARATMSAGNNALFFALCRVDSALALKCEGCDYAAGFVIACEEHKFDLANALDAKHNCGSAYVRALSSAMEEWSADTSVSYYGREDCEYVKPARFIIRKITRKKVSAAQVHAFFCAAHVDGITRDGVVSFFKDT